MNCYDSNGLRLKWNVLLILASAAVIEINFNTTQQLSNIMLSKTAAACAIIMLGAQATEAENWNRGYAAAPYAAAPYSAPSYGYKAAPYQKAYNSYPAFEWGRRSTYRPRDVKAYNTDKVDAYWKNEVEKETIQASCEFDFLGYSHSSGRIALEQKPGDNTSMIGEFAGIKPGIHALKVHEFGDLEYGCESTGDVFNPFGAYRGHSHDDIWERRVGDVEQVQGRWDTKAEYKNRDALVMLSGPNSVLGRSLVLYEREDDHDQTEHPATYEREGRYREGEGKRIACCVIGLAKGEKEMPKPVQKPSQKLPEKPTYHAAPSRGYGFAPRLPYW